MDALPAIKNIHMIFHEYAIEAHVLFVPVFKLLATRRGLKDIGVIDFGQCMAHAVKVL